MEKILLLLAFLMTAFVCECVSASGETEISVQLGHQDSDMVTVRKLMGMSGPAPEPRSKLSTVTQTW